MQLRCAREQTVGQAASI